MSELPPIDYSDTRRDQLLAEHVAHAEAPYVSAHETALRKGNPLHAELALKTMHQQSLAAREEFTLSEMTPQEKLAYWLEEGLVAQYIEDDSSSKVIEQLVEERGIPEVVTSSLVPEIRSRSPYHKAQQAGYKLFRDINPRSRRAHQRQVKIDYRTLTGPRPGASHYRMHDMDMSGSPLVLSIVLPEADAKELLALVEADPRIIREMADMQMQQNNTTGEDWARIKPPYDVWQAANSGAGKMFIAPNYKRPNEGTVLDFDATHVWHESTIDEAQPALPPPAAASAPDPHQAGTSPRSERAKSQVRAEDIAAKIAEILEGAGFISKPSAKYPSSLSGHVKGVESELSALQAQGQSEKKALRTLIKKYHSDANTDPAAAAKIRIVNSKLDAFNKQQGKRTAG